MKKKGLYDNDVVSSPGCQNLRGETAHERTLGDCGKGIIGGEGKKISEMMPRMIPIDGGSGLS